MKVNFDGAEIPHLFAGEELKLVAPVAADLVPLRSMSQAAKRFITRQRQSARWAQRKAVQR